MPLRKKSKSDLDYKPPKWSPGEPVAVLLFKDGVGYKIVGFEIFDEEKPRCLAAGKKYGGFAPIKLPPSKKPKGDELLIVRKGQTGRPIRYKENQVFKLASVPKRERKTFGEVFGYADGVTIVAGSYIESEQEDLNFGLSPLAEEIIEEED